MSIGPTPETVSRILDRLETELVAEIETRLSEFDEKPITHFVGTWYLSAIHSQLVRLDDSGLLSRRDRLRSRFPFVTGDEPEQEILEAMAHRFVVAEVLSGKTDHLRALSWQIIGELVEEELIGEELNLNSIPFEFGTGNPVGLSILRNLLDQRNGYLANLQGQLRAALSFAEEAGSPFDRTADSIREALSRFETQIAGLEAQRRNELDIASKNESEIFAGGQLLAGGRHIGYGDHLDRLRNLSQERIEGGETELSSDYGEYLRLIRKAFLGWLRAFRGVSVENLGEFEYLWSEPTHSLVMTYRTTGLPKDHD